MSATVPPLPSTFHPLLERLAGEASPGGFFDPGRPVLAARAPGRLDVMGGIADYSGSLVLEWPLDVATLAVLQPAPGRRVEIASLREEGTARLALDLDLLAEGDLRTPEALGAWCAEAEAPWAAYLLGAVYVSLHELGGEAGRGGFRMAVVSEVPEGKGVSSSAALEVAALAVVSRHFGAAPDPEATARWGQFVENRIVGAPCGLMDQMTSACGRAGRLLRLLCQPGRIEGWEAVPEGFAFFGIDSGVRHAVSGADYGTVRAAAFMGYRILAEWEGLRVVAEEGGRVRVEEDPWGGYLANVGVERYEARYAERLPAWITGAEFLARYGGTTDAATSVRPDGRYPVGAATAHPIYEHERVARFAALLPSFDPALPAAALEAGRLMRAAHESYGACGLGSEATDLLVDLAEEAGPERGIYGAKITGGGSGGTVAVLARSDAGAAVRAVAERYERRTGRAPRLFAGTSEGLAGTGVWRLDPGAGFRPLGRT